MCVVRSLDFLTLQGRADAGSHPNLASMLCQPRRCRHGPQDTVATCPRGSRPLGQPVSRLQLRAARTPALYLSGVWQNHPKRHTFGGTCLPLDTKHPKLSQVKQFHRAHPKGELKTIHALHPGFNNEYELTILSPFHTT
jgi:hypothetical protein